MPEIHIETKVQDLKRFDSGFTILSTPDGKLVGETSDDVRIGQQYRFSGDWVYNEKWGKQFRFSSYVVRIPLDRESIVAYLQTRKGIGTVTAGKAWDKWGIETIDKMIVATAEELEEVGIRNPASVQEWLKNDAVIRDTKAKLIGMLGGRGFPKDLVQKLIEDHGVRGPAMIEADMFGTLLKYDRVGFRTVDRLWLETGHEMEDMTRGVWATWYAIHSKQDGSVWYKRSEVYSEIRTELQTAALKVSDCIKAAIDKKLVLSIERDGTVWYAAHGEAHCEHYLAAEMVRKVHSYDDRECGYPVGVKWPNAMAIDGLTCHQQEQLDLALSGPIGILTGGPGTGKTYTVAKVIEQILATREHVKISCPTGKAAVRCMEAMRANGLPNVLATTHHKALEWGFDGPARDSSKPMDEMWHILDEQSMVDNRLAWLYHRAVRFGAHVLFILDPYQLSPVGRGSPLLELIRYGVPFGQLTEPQRNCGQVVLCCQEIRRTGRFVPSREFVPDEGQNLLMTEAKTSDRMIQDMRDWVERLAAAGADTMRDIQVVCPRRVRSQLSCEKLNPILQEMMNPNGEKIESSPYRIGDKVICLKNGFYGGTEKGQQEYIANGEQGVIIADDKKYRRMVVEFEGPTRLVTFGRRSESLDMGYAITGHKSQGSEWPWVLTVFDPSYFAGSLEWVTTGISRPKLGCVGIGTTETAQKWCRKSGSQNRKTFLCDLMREKYRGGFDG